MGDEEDPWGFDDAGDSAPAAEVPAESAAAPQAATPGPQAATPTGETAAVETVEGEPEPVAPPPPPPEDDGYRKPVQLYRHWVR